MCVCIYFAVRVFLVPACVASSLPSGPSCLPTSIILCAMGNGDCSNGVVTSHYLGSSRHIGQPGRVVFCLPLRAASCEPNAAVLAVNVLTQSNRDLTSSDSSSLAVSGRLAEAVSYPCFPSSVKSLWRLPYYGAVHYRPMISPVVV